MRKPSFVLPIAIGAMALAGLVMANIMAQKNRPRTEAELMQEEQERQPKAPQSGAPPGQVNDDPPPVAMKKQSTTDDAPKMLSEGNDLAALGPDYTAPASGAKGPSVTIGYEWTPELQANPDALAQLVKKVQEQVPGAQLRLVNVDANPQTPAGIAINNTVVAPPGDDGNIGSDALDGIASRLKSAK
jgi:hypothetical protein